MYKRQLILTINAFNVLVVGILAESRYILLLYLFACLADYITGILKVFVVGEKFSKTKAIQGIFRKCTTCFYIFVTASLDLLFIENNIHFLKSGITRPFVMWLTLNELLSILDNIEKSDGTKGSEILKKLITQIQEVTRIDNTRSD